MVPTFATVGFDECHERSLRAMLRYAVVTHGVSLDQLDADTTVYDAEGYEVKKYGPARLLVPMSIQVSATMSREEMSLTRDLVGRAHL